MKNLHFAVCIRLIKQLDLHYYSILLKYEKNGSFPMLFFLTELSKKTYDYRKIEHTKRNYLFIDEIQDIEDFEMALRHFLFILIFYDF